MQRLRTEIPGGLIEQAQLDGPVLAGQIWEGRGTQGHQIGLRVTVERLSAAGRVIFTKEKRHGGRTYTLDEPTFRTSYRMVKQAPLTHKTVDALAFAVSATLSRQGPDTVDAVIREGRALNVANEIRTQPGPAPEGAPPEAAAPPPPPAPAPSPNGQQPAALAAPEAPAAPTPPPEPEPDPLEAFVASGLATLDRLNTEVRRLGEDRELARLELEELEAKLADAHRKRDRASRGIEAALVVLRGGVVAPVVAQRTAKLPGTPSIIEPASLGPAHAPAPDQAAVDDYARRLHISKEAAAARLATGPRLRGASAPGAVLGQRAFFEAFVREHPRFAFTELKAAHLAAYGMADEDAGRRVAGFLADRTKRPRPGQIALVRTAPGQYARRPEDQEDAEKHVVVEDAAALPAGPTAAAGAAGSW